ncbi:MAG: hypothetical protein Q9174_005559 [Haloplaca sp. 1 TL-2023]
MHRLNENGFWHSSRCDDVTCALSNVQSVVWTAGTTEGEGCLHVEKGREYEQQDRSPQAPILQSPRHYARMNTLDERSEQWA